MTIYIFDMDGTLTPPRLPMTSEFAQWFHSWQKQHCSYIATGSDFKKVQEQLPEEIIRAFTGIYCSMGNVLIQNGKTVYQKDFRAPEGLYAMLEDFRRNSAYPGPFYDNYIENRIGMVNFSVLGRDCPYEAREQYSRWDREHHERLMIRDTLAQHYPDYEISVGGSISIDIVPQGCGKGQIAHHLRSVYRDEQIVFFGDRTLPGGNDYELAQELTHFRSTTSVQVDGPDDVREKLMHKAF